MSANKVTTLPLGPLDPERTELLLRVVEGLEPSTLQWLSGFAAGVAHERASGRSLAVLPAVRGGGCGRRPCRAHGACHDRLRLADRQQQAHRRKARAVRRRPPDLRRACTQPATIR